METKLNNNLNILGPSQAITRQEESLSREKGTKIQNIFETFATCLHGAIKWFFKKKYSLHITR